MYADRVKQSVTSPGSGTVTLPGAASTGYQTFLSAFGSGSTLVSYCIADQAGNSWEVGTGTYNGTANTLTRSSVFASSNSNSLVNFSSGIQDVFCTAPAKYLDVFTATNQGTVPASGGGNGFLRADGMWTSPAASMAMDGADGEDGMPGPPGIAGATGSAGTTGTTGSQGAAGVSGEDGIDGDAGPPGLQGATGATGSTGAIGASGPMGMMGEDGADGDIGPPGSVGIAGSAGAAGSNGKIGPAGEDGSDADAFLIGIPTLQAAGSTTQIQYNNAGVFGASSNFTYNTGTNTFTVGPAGATTTIETLAPTGATVAGTMLFRGKNASATNGNGGGFTFTPGNALGTGTGGGATFNTGSGRNGGNLGFTAANGTVNGGNVTFNSGNGDGATGVGGNFTMTAGLGSTTASGGNFEMTAGAAASSGAGGGFIMLAGGSVSGTGGDFTIVCGFGVPSGNIYLNADSGTVIQVTQDATPTLQLGFFGTTPVAQAAAYTKTYSTASRTIPNATFTNLATTAATNVAPYGFTTAAQADAIATKVNALAADVLILKQLIVSLVNDSSTTLGVGLNAT
jgi:hypothetical protein